MSIIPHIEPGSLGDWLKAKAIKAWNWAIGRKSRINPLLKRRLDALKAGKERA